MSTVVHDSMLRFDEEEECPRLSVNRRYIGVFKFIVKSNFV
jgi:hypothetical protein